MKRLFDLIVSLFLLVCFSPIILCIAILIRTKLGSPVIFKQQRPGQYGIPFYIFKFRTMTDERGNDGELLPDHMRLTSLGKFLRKYSLDELVQLLNVLKGDISIVGPRPLLMEYLPLYDKNQAKRHLVKPGITGWAQVNGRNAITWEEKFELDVWYVENQSFFIDIKIILITILKVIHPEGINQPGNKTIDSFKGSKNTIKEGHR